MFLLEPGVLLTLQNLILVGSVAGWDPGLAFIHHGPNSRVRLHFVVRANPRCPADTGWLRRGMEATPLPAGYKPPKQLYDEEQQGRYDVQHLPVVTGGTSLSGVLELLLVHA